MRVTDLTCFSEQACGTPVFLLNAEQYSSFVQQHTAPVRSWLKAHDFEAKNRQYCVVPDSAGHILMVCVGFGQDEWLTAIAELSHQLPPGHYHLANAEDFTLQEAYQLSLGWGLGAYRFTRYKKPTRLPAQWILPAKLDATRLRHELAASFWARDLINTPAEDMMPEDLASQAESLTQRFQGQFHQVVGDELLQHGYPMVHAVGRASQHAPRLLDLRFGAQHWPKVTLVGKGVCFDTGGLDIKPASGMLTMKKDMGGAAHALALAQLILAQGLAVQLRVLIPAVDNAISGNAFRPGDILTSRQGKTVEIGNTDAEGRLILADALAAAVEEAPDYLINFATLTGAARVAVGTDIAAYFCNDEALAQSVAAASDTTQDPCWRLPLFKGYRALLKSSMADLNNAPGGGYAGAITAALFLQEFVPDTVPWLHVDVMAFNLKSSPAKPEGGEAMGLRAVFHVLEQKFKV